MLSYFCWIKLTEERFSSSFERFVLESVLRLLEGIHSEGNLGTVCVVVVADNYFEQVLLDKSHLEEELQGYIFKIQDRISVPHEGLSTLRHLHSLRLTGAINNYKILDKIKYQS